jgi:glyoxylase-like metal-dependent hydrolase (beta-lactamase superfamily II)
MAFDAFWDLYALPFARLEQRRVHDHFIVRDMHDGPMPVDFYVWVARKGEHTVLIDTGFGQQSAAKRSRPLTVDPVEALQRIGIAPQDVTDVIITHLHYDHAGAMDRFPNAKVHVQDREVGFVTGRCMCHAHLRLPFEADDVITLIRRLHAGDVVFHNGDDRLCEGISLHLLPGHTPGLQGVRVMTKRGTVLIASDAAHYYANVLECRPYILSLDLTQTLDTYERLFALVDHPNQIIPGHDPQVRELFPRVEINGVELAVLHEAPRWPPIPVGR